MVLNTILGGNTQKNKVLLMTTQSQSNNDA
jgi:hypothetical protein